MVIWPAMMLTVSTSVAPFSEKEIGQLCSSVCTWHKLIGKLWPCLLFHTNGPTLVPRQFLFLYETKVDQGMSLVNWELIICQIGVWISHNSYCLWVVEHRKVWLGTLTESVSVNGACLQSVVSLPKYGSTTESGDTWCSYYMCTNPCKFYVVKAQNV